jgi:hypothetical protein
MTVISHWTNQDIVLYHGTNAQYADAIIADGVNVKHGLATRGDFGIGFYCPTILSQAKEWASKNQRLKGEPAIIAFDIPRDELATLNFLSFVLAEKNSDDFWNFVQFCREHGIAHGRNRDTHPDGFDVVCGPMSSDYEQRIPMRHMDQISFHTLAGQNVLNSVNPKRIL